MQKSTDLRKMFVKFDWNNDGEISRKEFRKVTQILNSSPLLDSFLTIRTELERYYQVI